jgi:uncharacterized membrane protein YidH (DUF202 family)
VNAAGGDPEYDRGVATERTNLSWKRTCLALGALAMLSLRLAVGEAVMAVALTGVGVAASMLLLGHARHRYETLPDDIAAGRPVVHPWSVAALTATVVVFGILVIVAVLAAG